MSALQLQFEAAPQRVISLVPSITESLFDLGLGGSLIGISDYCTQPQGKLGHLPRLGGPKTPDLDAIIALQPELVLANMEENSQAGVEALEAAGLAVWVTFPTTVSGALQVLYDTARLFRSAMAQASVQTLELTVEWALQAAVDRPARRYFCPIWQDSLVDGSLWWMTFNANTYCTDILRLVGGENVFAGRIRRYPLEADLGRQAAEPPEGRDVRYPRLTAEEIRAAQPELILLPDEPYTFSEQHSREIERLLPDVPVRRLDGSLITWPGTRLARALRELPPLFEG